MGLTLAVPKGQCLRDTQREELANDVADFLLNNDVIVVPTEATGYVEKSRRLVIADKIEESKRAK